MTSSQGQKISKIYLGGIVSGSDCYILMERNALEILLGLDWKKRKTQHYLMISPCHAERQRTSFMGMGAVHSDRVCAQKGPTLGLTLCCHHPEIPNTY